ncbi:MAG: hypothetical protein ABWZ89_12780, partial [Acidimicrobiales bacterium]
MGALTVTGLGVVLVGVEFRLNAIDVLADPLGWLFVALGAWMLAARGPCALALLAAPLSAAGAYLTFRTVLVDSATDNAVIVCPHGGFCYEQIRFDDLGSLRAMALLGMALAGGGALVWILRILRTEVGPPTSDVTLRDQMWMLEILVPLVWALPVVLLAGIAIVTGDGYDPVWSERLEPVTYA